MWTSGTSLLDPQKRGRPLSGTPCGHGIPGSSRTRREMFSGDSGYIPSQNDVTPNIAVYDAK